jgi:hypothetical protein
MSHRIVDDDTFEQIIASEKPVVSWPIHFTGRSELIRRKFQV